MTAADVQAVLAREAEPDQAAQLQRFFKTGPGEYGEGDVFRGLRVPMLRRTAKAFRGLPLAETERLLRSPYHEDRLTALFILVEQARRGDETTRERIASTYLGHTAHVNNWDLVDASAEHLLGAWLWDRDRSVLDRLAASASLWERRIAVMATCHFVKRGAYADTLRLAERLLGDREDLIHKAVGWMLREIGNRDLAAERAFLDAHAAVMPRTMLRYAIEKFPEPLRRSYLKRT